MQRNRLTSWLALGVMALVLAGAGRAQAQSELRETGRKIAGDLGNAIATVRVVISVKASQNGQQAPEQEAKGETSGTVIAPDGTTIVPLSELDPAPMIKRVAGDRADGYSIDTRIKDLKIIIDKKTELPATVVMRDPDLDLAVIRPVDKVDEPLKFVDLSNSAEPQLLDQVFVLARMGRVADYQVGVMTGEIQSIVTKPRRFYIPSAELASGGYGVPIFTAEGKLVGLVLMRAAQGGGDESFGPGGGSSGMIAMILPASDVKSIADQAKPQ